jgi:hypothetical protein
MNAILTSADAVQAQACRRVIPTLLHATELAVPVLPLNLAPAFALGFGPDYLLTNNFQLIYMQDAQLAPDGGFPAVTNGLPPANPQNTLRQGLNANDLVRGRRSARRPG